MTCIIGIDPGQTGAIAVLSSTGEFERADDLHTVSDGRLTWIHGGWLQSFLIDATRGRHAVAVIERVGSMPKQGVASSFSFGVGFGSVLSVLQARHLPVNLVTAATWKRALNLPRDKAAALDRARLLFPTASLDRAKDIGRGEALLIAHYWWQQRPTQPVGPDPSQPEAA
jgi:crossover junction endodeoxyribonuclease RuvC